MTWGKWEVVNIIFRFVDMISWLPRQLLISVAFLGTSLNANGQLAEIIKAIQRLDLRDDLNGLIALIADRHGVNKKTVDKIESNVDLQAKCFLVGCCSHTLDNSGDHFNIPNGLCCVFVINFRLFNLLIVNCSSGKLLLLSWTGLFKNSRTAELIFLTIAKESISKPGATRWWCKWIQSHQFLRCIVKDFLFLNKVLLKCKTLELCKASVEKLFKIVCHKQLFAKCLTELAALVDYGAPFVKATYLLEGDQPLFIVVSKIMTNVFAGEIMHRFKFKLLHIFISNCAGARHEQIPTPFVDQVCTFIETHDLFDDKDLQLQLTSLNKKQNILQRKYTTQHAVAKKAINAVRRDAAIDFEESPAGFATTPARVRKSSRNLSRNRRSDDNKAYPRPKTHIGHERPPVSTDIGERARRKIVSDEISKRDKMKTELKKLQSEIDDLENKISAARFDPYLYTKEVVEPVF